MNIPTRILTTLISGTLLFCARAAGAADAPGDPAKATKETPFENSLGMKFVPVPVTDGATGGQKVLFSVWVTRVKDYAVFAADSSKVNVKSKKSDFTQTDEHPVVNVSWEDATAFCEWLTKKELDAGRISAGMEYRLPTDVEWSCAVGLGKEEGATPAERSGKVKDVYPWGRSWPPPLSAGNYGKIAGRADDGYEYTSPVGSFDANELGLYDMGGNVVQWCQDKYDATNDWRVLRGSSWYTVEPDRLFSSCRSYYTPDYRFNHYGFRCVLAVPGA